jgi:hypothetical protein
MELRYRACLLLLCATAQAGAATAALVVVPPSGAGRFLAFFANVLGLLMLGHLARVVLRVLFATGAVFCLTNDRPCTVELAIYAILAYVFVLAIPLLSFLGQ